MANKNGDVFGFLKNIITKRVDAVSKKQAKEVIANNVPGMENLSEFIKQQESARAL